MPGSVEKGLHVSDLPPIVEIPQFVDYSDNEKRLRSIHFSFVGDPWKKEELFWRKLDEILRQAAVPPDDEVLERFDFETNLARAKCGQSHQLWRFPHTHITQRIAGAILVGDTAALTILMDVFADRHTRHCDDGILVFRNLWELEPEGDTAKAIIQSWWRIFKVHGGRNPTASDVMEIGGFWDMPRERVENWLNVLEGMARRNSEAYEWVIDRVRPRGWDFKRDWHPRHWVRAILDGSLDPRAGDRYLQSLMASRDIAAIDAVITELDRQIAACREAIRFDTEVLPEFVALAERDITKQEIPAIITGRMASVQERMAGVQALRDFLIAWRDAALTGLGQDGIQE